MKLLMNDYIIIFLGFILDFILGDPYFLYHPVRIIGNLINFLDKNLNKIKYKQKLMGLITLVTTSITTFMVVKIFVNISPSIFINDIIKIYIVYTIFSTKCLAYEGKKIFKALENSDLESSRKLMSYLVSRETKNMTEEDIIKATIETLTENIVDGIISPMFFLIFGGIEYAYFYKAVNTLDSMIGYKNEKYKDFGYFSAKFDDILNYIPARIGAIIVVISSFILGYDYKNSFKIMLRDRKNHSSPNSAYPESASAGALNIQLGGKAVYFGKVEDKPTMGDKNKKIENKDILKAIKLVYMTSILSYIIFTIACIFLKFIF